MRVDVKLHIFIMMYLTTMKQSVFVIIQRVDTGEILCVVDGRDKISIPGGKAEPNDSNQFQTLMREYQEEVRLILPHRRYDHFQWGNAAHTIRVYFTRIDPRSADEICDRNEIRENDNPFEHIVSIRWMQPSQTRNVKHHIRHALRIWGQVDTRKKLKCSN